MLDQKEADMGRQRHTGEQNIGKLREAEVLLGKGMPMEEVLRQLGISDATYYHEVVALPQVAGGVWGSTGRSGEAVKGAGTGEQSITEGGVRPID
jgi:hypothetical protein